MTMPDYKRMYFQLAAKVADVIDALIEAQQQGENDYIQGEAPIFILTDNEPEQEDGKKMKR